MINYDPQPRQQIFHQNPARHRCFLGGWRGGKTYAGCAEALKQSLMFKNNRGLIGRKDFSDLRDTTLQTFFDLCPEEIIESYNKSEHFLRFKNGSEILFRELKDGTGIGSLNLGWVFIDEAEEVQESMFDRLAGGRLSLTTTKRQCIWLASNPPNKDHWIYRRFVTDKNPNYFLINSSTYENRQYLPTGYIENLEKMPESWKHKYLFGEFGFTPDGKPFYSGYTETMHKGKFEWNSNQELILGWDYGKHHPACLVTQLGSDGRWYILKEIMGKDETIYEFSDKVFRILNLAYPGATYRHFGDPAGTQVNDKSDTTSEKILRSKGINVLSRKSEYSERKEIIDRLLNTMIVGKPSLMVDESCGIVNDGFLGGYHYPESKDGKPIDEMPVKDGYYEHLMNALEYIAVNIFTAVNRVEIDYQRSRMAGTRSGWG